MKTITQNKHKNEIIKHNINNNNNKDNDENNNNNYKNDKDNNNNSIDNNNYKIRLLITCNFLKVNK